MGLGKLRGPRNGRRKRFPKWARAHRHGWQVAIYPWGDARRVRAVISDPKSSLKEVLG